jgi:hypothetical protein
MCSFKPCSCLLFTEIEEKTSGKNTTEDIRQTLAIFEKRASEELEGIRRDLKRLQEAHFGASGSGSQPGSGQGSPSPQAPTPSMCSTSSESSSGGERSPGAKRRERLRREFFRHFERKEDDRGVSKQESMEVEEEEVVEKEANADKFESLLEKQKRKSKKRALVIPVMTEIGTQHMLCESWTVNRQSKLEDCHRTL